ncbi:Ail/Lom family outer membrane beta-barrel protein, partial [Vibrio pectenicida]
QKHILKKYYNVPTLKVLVLQINSINIIVSSYLTIHPYAWMSIDKEKCMKKTITIAALLGAATFNAQAAEHTVSLGYAQTDIKHIDSALHGLTLKYRYEGTSPVGFIASLTGTADSDSRSRIDPGLTITTVSETNRSYGSFHIGPTYRINEVVSAYATVGYARLEIENKQLGRTTSKIEDESFAAGGGFEFNLSKSFAINTGVELSEHLSDARALSYSVSLGYRF